MPSVEELEALRRKFKQAEVDYKKHQATFDKEFPTFENDATYQAAVKEYASLEVADLNAEAKSVAKQLDMMIEESVDPTLVTPVKMRLWAAQFHLLAAQKVLLGLSSSVQSVLAQKLPNIIVNQADTVKALEAHAKRVELEACRSTPGMTPEKSRQLHFQARLLKNFRKAIISRELTDDMLAYYAMAFPEYSNIKFADRMYILPVIQRQDVLHEQSAMVAKLEITRIDIDRVRVNIYKRDKLQSILSALSDGNATIDQDFLDEVANDFPQFQLRLQLSEDTPSEENGFAPSRIKDEAGLLRDLEQLLQQHYTAITNFGENALTLDKKSMLAKRQAVTDLLDAVKSRSVSEAVLAKAKAAFPDKLQGLRFADGYVPAKPEKIAKDAGGKKARLHYIF